MDGFDPCVVLLNNDLSAGIPGILRGIGTVAAAAAARGLGGAAQVEPFRRVPRSRAGVRGACSGSTRGSSIRISRVRRIDFRERKGEECLEGYVAEILDDIRAKYREYKIEAEPFVIVKADAGTYGMGIMTVKDPSEVRGLNRRQRNKMAVVKEGLEVHDVIVQEGVYSFETVDDAVAEPVVYMIDHLRGRRLLSRSHEPRQGREPERAGHAVRAARVRRAVLFARSRRSRVPAEPLLCLRRHRTARAARRGASNSSGPRTHWSRNVGRAHQPVTRRRRVRAAIERLRWKIVRPVKRARTMKLAFIVDPLDEFKIYKDTTFAIMREAAARGHELYAMHQDDLAWTQGAVTGYAARLHLTGKDDETWYLLEPPRRTAAHGLRRGAHAQGSAVRHGVRLQHVPARARRSSRARASSTARARCAITTRRWRSRGSPQFTAPTLVTRREDLIRAFLAEHGDVILKPLRRHGRHLDLPRARERSERERHHRDADRTTARGPSWCSATSRRSATATSACC